MDYPELAQGRSEREAGSLKREDGGGGKVGWKDALDVDTLVG